MSIKVMSYVWDQSRQQGSALLVLLAIADWARDDGTHAHPTVPMLAAKTRLSDRSIQRIIADLESSGEVQVQRSTGRGRAHVYSIRMAGKGDILSPDTNVAESKGDTGGPERVTSDAVKGDTPRMTNRHTQPSIEPSERVPQEKQGPLITDPVVWPESYSILWGIKGFKLQLNTYLEWLSEKGIPESFALNVVYGLRDWLLNTAPGRKRMKAATFDPWLTFTNWAHRDWKKEKGNGIVGEHLQEDSQEADRLQRLANRRGRTVGGRVPEV